MHTGYSKELQALRAHPDFDFRYYCQLKDDSYQCRQQVCEMGEYVKMEAEDKYMAKKGLLYLALGVTGSTLSILNLMKIPSECAFRESGPIMQVCPVTRG